MSSELLSVEISSQPIELCKLLKIANFVSGGGEAKIVISEGYVLLNDEVEFQKRKKVYHDDIVEFNGEIIQVLCKGNKRVSAAVKKEQNTNKKSKNKKNNENKVSANKTITENVEPMRAAKRRPISF